MRLSWKMGRVAGIDLYIHATFLLVFLFMPNVGGGGLRAIEAILLICSVFGCVLLHELGHALMARRFGIGTVDITLYPIGGVARLQRLPRAPGAELLIALAGPAVNFVIAAILYCFLVLLGGATAGPAGSLGVFVFELMCINLGLGLFNLVPAFPMDGGRVLRAALSTGLGRARATQIASKVGQILAVVFVLGAYTWTGSLNPMHLALAAFIFFAARSEEAHVLYEERRRAAVQGNTQGMWVAPPGYRWVHRGNGLWQLAPLGGGFADQTARDASAWR
jgi:Zn-dependent protease